MTMRAVDDLAKLLRRECPLDQLFAAIRDTEAGPLTREEEMDDELIPRQITRDVMDELFAWTHNAPMFRASPQGRVFAMELRNVFRLACEVLENRSWER